MPTSADVIRAKRRAIGGRRLRCKKGKSCSAACINRNKFCLVDAPTPVAGALPRAVKAIQARKERLGPKEKRQASQKRREYVKSKVSARLAEQRKKLIKERNSIIVQLKIKIFKGDSYSDRVQLENKLKKLEEVGKRLKVPPAAPIRDREVSEGFSTARNSLQRRVMDLNRQLRQAANPTTPGALPNRHLYDQIERKLLALSKNKDAFFWDYRTRPMVESDRGKVWKNAQIERLLNRADKYSKVLYKLMGDAKEAAKSGDLKKYREIEAKLLKVQQKGGSKFPIYPKNEKGKIWKEVRVPEALKKLADSMKDALESGDLSKYNSLETKFLKVRDRHVGTDTRKSDKLWTAIGSNASLRKGEMLGDHLKTLKRSLENEAFYGDRRKYNELEGKYLKLNPEATKGGIWRDRIMEKVKGYLNSVHQDMYRAAADKNRKTYDRLERILMRHYESLDKGQTWREVRISRAITDAISKMESAAKSGDRRTYNKLEKTLFKMESKIYGKKPSFEKGELWMRERGNLALGKLREEMEKAAISNNRERYEKLEASFFKVRDKIGDNNVRDGEARWLSKGEVWRDVKQKAVLYEAAESLNKGRGESVERITIKGSPDNFTVTSIVLGNMVELHISPNDTTSFTVNGSYKADPGMSRRESFAITREVMRQYDDIIGRMPNGTVFSVSAARGDGREEMREKAYVGFGFSQPSTYGEMYGKVVNGKMVPIDEDEYDDMTS